MSYWVINTVVILFILQRLVCSAIAGAYITGKATCFNFLEFYADGVRYEHYNDNNWKYFTVATIPSSTKVVAARCENPKGQCGLKIFLSNGVNTDTSWKCSDNEEDGWNTVRFDDSNWKNAKMVPRAPNFIWTSDDKFARGAIYCRKSVRAGSNHRNASYRKSNIVINSCDPSRYLKTIYTSWEMDCSRACTRKIDCSRYLYCSGDASCKLYRDGRDCIMSGDTTGCSCYTQVIHCEDSGCTCPLGQYGEGCQDTISGNVKALEYL
ncbi:hypothetical protein SNE40_017442 [Patella caerulea]|uniref:EGF-like domain-containing protein n=1 Tax=Patella caerulea TaxID=87958 RepID=A0AAN8P9R1_PATCE